MTIFLVLYEFIDPSFSFLKLQEVYDFIDDCDHTLALLQNNLLILYYTIDLFLIC